MSDMYARKERDGFYTLRQRRYAERLASGKEHPHDICATARSLDELKTMCAPHWPDADYSGAD